VVDFYLFDTPEVLSGLSATVYFHKFISQEKPFNSTEEMQKQLQIDRAQVDELIF